MRPLGLFVLAGWLLGAVSSPVEAAERARIDRSILADMLDISREHLTRAFLKELSIPPYEFIIQRKMRTARHYLQHTNLTCKEIAHELGFKSAAQFSDVFRRSCGMAPSAWRLHGGRGERRGRRVHHPPGRRTGLRGERVLREWVVCGRLLRGCQVRRQGQ